MSRLLLRKALDLFEEEDKKKQNTGSQRKSKVKRSDSVAEFKKIGLQTMKGKLKRKEKNKIKDSIQDLQMKCVLDEVKKRKDADLTIDNIAILQRMSKQSAIESVPINNILKHQTGRLAKNVPSIAKVQPKVRSMFSEEDFDKFEKEYFVKL